VNLEHRFTSTGDGRDRGRVVNAGVVRPSGKKAGAGVHGEKPRKIGEGRTIRSGERLGVSSSHLSAFAKPSRNTNVTTSRRSEIEV
jgi:hypothetical protein